MIRKPRAEARRASGRPEARAAIAALFAFTWSTAVFRLFFQGASTFEFAHYAEIGRNILQGRGFTTRVLYPGTVALLNVHGLAAREYAPALHRFPLPALLSAASQLVLGSTDFGAVAGTLALFSLWVALVYHAGRLWFSERTAVLSALLFAAVPAGAKYFVLFNYPDVHYGALLFLFHYLLASAPERLTARRASGLGLLAGVVWLSRSNFWLSLPLYLAFIAWRDPDRKSGALSCGLFLASFLAATAPMTFYAAREGAAVTPDAIWNLAHHVVSERQVWLDYRVYTLPEVLVHWRALLAKGATTAHTFLFDLPTLWQLQFVWPFFALGLSRLPSGPARRFFGLALGAALLQIPVFSFLRFDSWGLGVGYRYLFWVCPVIVLIGVHGLLRLAEDLSRRAGRAVVAAWLVLNACLFVPYYSHEFSSLVLRHPSGKTPWDWPEVAYLREHLLPGQSVISNIPTQLGWYASVPAIALPNDPADVPRLAAARPSAYLFLSFINIGTLGDFPQWLALIQPDAKGLEAYCRANGYRIAAVMPSVGVLVDLQPMPEGLSSSSARQRP